jgi:hypothetical protein
MLSLMADMLPAGKYSLLESKYAVTNVERFAAL